MPVSSLHRAKKRTPLALAEARFYDRGSTTEVLRPTADRDFYVRFSIFSDSTNAHKLMSVVNNLLCKLLVVGAAIASRRTPGRAN